MFRSHERNPEGVTTFADREPLPKSPAEIRQRPLAPNSDFLEELSEWRLAKYTGQPTRKPPQASVGRNRTIGKRSGLTQHRRPAAD